LQVLPSIIIDVFSFYVISGLRREEDENRALMGDYTASSGNFLPTFRDNLSVPSSRVKNPQRKPGILVRGLYKEQGGR
jgi:hypothetical protein